MATVQRWGRKEAIIPASAGAGLQTGNVHLCVHCERNIHLYSPSYGLSPVLPPYRTICGPGPRGGSTSSASPVDRADEEEREMSTTDVLQDELASGRRFARCRLKMRARGSCRRSKLTQALRVVRVLDRLGRRGTGAELS
jgi:hypothetical protein